MKLGALADSVGGRISYQQCDITDEDGIAQAFSDFVPKMRYPLRGVVACAGISDQGPAVEFPVSKFRRIFDINVTGIFLTARAAAKEIQRTGISGSMVLVASMSGSVVNKVRIPSKANFSSGTNNVTGC